MTRDLAAIARLVDASIAGDAIPANRPIDDAVLIEDFTVVAHTDFVSLVFVSPGELLAILRSAGDRLGLLRGAAVITAGDDTDIAAIAGLAEEARITVLLCPGQRLDVVHLSVLAILAKDTAAEARLVTAGTRVLTQVARRGGIRAVVDELARRLDGWGVLLDSHAQVITSAGAGALHLDDAVAVALQRPVRVRHPGLQVHLVGQAEDARAFLVVASRNATTSRTRDLSAQAAALIDLLLRTHDYSATERLGRDVMMRAVLGGAVGSGSSLLRRWGVRDESMSAFVISSRTKSVDLERLVSRWLGEMGAALTITMEKGRLTGLLPEDAVDDFATRVESFVGEAHMPLRCGIGSAAALDVLASSMAEARQAHDTALLDGQPVLRYQALSTVRFVLNSLDQDAIAQLTRSIEALSDQPALIETLSAYLSEHGSWGVAAQRLGIHRHTLKSRIHQIEVLTGLSMSNPDDRFSAWLALRSATYRTTSP